MIDLEDKDLNKTKYFTVKIKPDFYEKIDIQNILYIKSCGDYAEIHFFTNISRKVVHTNLLKIQKILPDNFFRCCRAFLINLNYVNKIENLTINLGTEKISVSQDLKKELLAKLNYINLSNL